MSASPLFTVFTPTYNRAHTIKRVFDSLCAQTLRDFEWLVVDDGSTDNTAELIAAWMQAADFSIRYFKQGHSGKHFAHNLAVQEARGMFFLPFDSDDACAPRALEKIAFYWNTIPLSERPSFFAVSGLCCDQYGKIIGDVFPSSPFDSNSREKHYVYKLRGEKWGAVLTEVMRRYPFPEIKDTDFAPEGIVWLEIAKTYKIRYVNEILRIYYVDDDSTGATLTKRRKLSENAAGRLHYYIWMLNNDLGYFFRAPMPFLIAATMLPIVAAASNQSIWRALQSLKKNSARTLVIMALPFSALLYSASRVSRAFAAEQKSNLGKPSLPSQREGLGKERKLSPLQYDCRDTKHKMD